MYMKPEMNVQLFDVEDVITASAPTPVEQPKESHDAVLNLDLEKAGIIVDYQ